MIGLDQLNACVVIDLETAGLSPTGRGAGFVVEVGACFVAEGRIVYTYQRLVRPEDPRRLFVPPFTYSAKVHKIEPDAIKREGIPEAQAAGELADLMERFHRRYGLIGWTAWNTTFEERWVAAREPWDFGPAAFDAMRVACNGGQGKLDATARALSLPVPRHLHRAVPDATLAAEVLLHLGHFGGTADVQPHAVSRPEPDGERGTPERHADCAGERWWVCTGMTGWVEVELDGWEPPRTERHGGRNIEHPGCWRIRGGLHNHHGVRLPFAGIWDVETVTWRRVAASEAA